MATQNPVIQTPAKLNLWRLFMLRNIAIVVQSMTMAGVYYGLDIDLALTQMVSIIVVLTLVNALTWLRLKQPWPVTDIEFFAQLLVDVMALTALLFYSGGSANPFVSLYLLPLIIAAATLPRVYSWAMGFLTVTCYSALMFYAPPLADGHVMHSEFGLHLLGMWVTFVVSALLIAIFIVRMSTTLRERDRALASYREDNLRNEKIVALGALAAGAAHELGTPLSTMAVVVKEMEQACAHLPSLAEDVHCLQEQIVLCKKTLTRLLSSSGQARADEDENLSLETFLNNTLEQWRLMRPTVPVSSQWTGTLPAPDVTGEQTLSQTLLNLLNNAADVSPEGVEIEGRWDQQEIIIEILDRGPGISAQVAHRAMEAFFTTKAPGQGFGLGLFLANATVERLGGKIRLFNRSGGGACTQVTLPLCSFQQAA